MMEYVKITKPGNNYPCGYSRNFLKKAKYFKGVSLMGHPEFWQDKIFRVIEKIERIDKISTIYLIRDDINKLDLFISEGGIEKVNLSIEFITEEEMEL